MQTVSQHTGAEFVINNRRNSLQVLLHAWMHIINEKLNKETRPSLQAELANLPNVSMKSQIRYLFQAISRFLLIRPWTILKRQSAFLGKYISF